MITSESPLQSVYEGWDGYQTSIVTAVAPLTSDQLQWRPSSDHRSIGEIARHISLGRVNWFVRMAAPGSAEIAAEISEWDIDDDKNRQIVEDSVAITEHPSESVAWLKKTWAMVEETLTTWQVGDLSSTYRHDWNGSTYANSRQWTIWRIMAHDIHHGGEISLMLGMQGIEAFELSALGGHTVLSPLADSQ